MKFTCATSSITEAVNIVQKAVAVRSTLPVLEGIFIKAGDGKVALTGNDLEIGIECITGADIITEGSVVVNSSLFGNTIRKLTADTVSIEVSSNNTVEIKSGNSHIKLNGISAEEFPEIPKFETEYDIVLTQREFKELIRRTIFAVGTSESKLILTGCLMEAEGSAVRMVAIDGFRLALKKVVTEGESVRGYLGGASIVIPSKTLKEVNNIISESDEKIIIKCSQKNVRLEFDNVIFTSRLLEGDYIDYKKIIPTEYKTRIKTDIKAFTEAVDRASVIITSEVAKSPLCLNISNGMVRITCETSSGRVEEVVPVEMEGPEIEIGFNNKYLLDALKNAEGEQVFIEFTGPVNPCLIRPTEGDGYSYIVLPVRLRSDS